MTTEIETGPLEYVREQIQHKLTIGRDPGTLYVDAYVLTYPDLFEITPYKHLDQFVKHSVPRGDIWADKQVPTVGWSADDRDYVVNEDSVAQVVIETELDLRQLAWHGHRLGQPGSFTPDLSEVDIVVAAHDDDDNKPQLLRQNTPVIVLDEWDEAPSFVEFREEGGWRE